MSTIRTSPLFAALLLLPLYACGNSPQQPSDTVDDRTAESPYLGGDEDSVTTDTAEVPDIGDSPSTSTSAPDPVLTGSVAQPPDLAAVTGRWAADPSVCEAAGGPVVTIGPGRFESIERSCTIADVIDGGNGSVTATLACPQGDQDDAQPELVKLTPAEGGLTLSFVGSDQPDQTLSRCPG